MNFEMPLTTFEAFIGDTKPGKALVTSFLIFGIDFPRSGELNEYAKILSGCHNTAISLTSRRPLDSE